MMIWGDSARYCIYKASQSRRELSHHLIDVILAEAIRDLQTVRSLDFLTRGEQAMMQQRTRSYLKRTTATSFADVDPFETENYRHLHPVKQAIDGVREILRMHLPKQISWSQKEKKMRKDLYETGLYKPERLPPGRIASLDWSFLWVVGSSCRCRPTLWHCIRISRPI